MPPTEPPVGKKQRIPAGSFEPAGGPNYALPGVPQIAPPPERRMPPALLFGLLLVLLVGAGGSLLFSSRPEPEEELTAEKLGALIHEQEQATRENAVALLQRQAGSGVLEIETFPPGADVTIDGTPAGETPLRRDRLPSQWYVLSIQKDGYQSVDSLVYLENGQRAMLSLALTSLSIADTEVESVARDEYEEEPVPRNTEELIRTPRPTQAPPQAAPQPVTPAPARPQAGSIRVTSSPTGVTVKLDGRSVGTTPLNLNNVAAGMHTVELALPDHEMQSFQVEVEAGQRNTLQAAMAPIATTPQTGSLSVVVHPWGSIYIDGTLHARDTDLRYEVTLPVGEHRVRVEHPSLGAWERTVNVTPDQPTSLTADLNPRIP